ncbi:hypothetical protein GA0061084_1042 [Arthrobacter sp. NIO-1057]|nr:hypothetical protein GA0061084_1042 [Arthrobacter sp. NIO-1057]
MFTPALIRERFGNGSIARKCEYSEGVYVCLFGRTDRFALTSLSVILHLLLGQRFVGRFVQGRHNPGIVRFTF